MTNAMENKEQFYLGYYLFACNLSRCKTRDTNGYKVLNH